jgi:hypothetical protein
LSADGQVQSPLYFHWWLTALIASRVGDLFAWLFDRKFYKKKKAESEILFCSENRLAKRVVFSTLEI